MIVAVTGTDTGVGKTVAVAALAARELAAGRSVLVVKPVQTGIGGADPDVPDVDSVGALTGCEAVQLAALDEPLAPDTAARRQGVEIPTVAEHAARIRDLASGFDTVLVEGAGGLLVRLDAEGGTLLDLADRLGAGVVVVARAGLGTLNHTELTCTALRARGIEPAGVVIGAWPEHPGLAATCNRTDLPRVTGVPLLALLPAGAGSLPRPTFLAAAPTWFTIDSKVTPG
ncbi:dethiobiotin synthase [Nocardioides panacisoli]|uniref:ATP-dependent dethiobiotin synthetase BioD n=1 Tax=Nocardioides panacisoli TaxID=627624 RepID=A0ABP7I154_9ACTN